MQINNNYNYRCGSVSGFASRERQLDGLGILRRCLDDPVYPTRFTWRENIKYDWQIAGICTGIYRNTIKCKQSAHQTFRTQNNTISQQTKEPAEGWSHQASHTGKILFTASNLLNFPLKTSKVNNMFRLGLNTFGFT